MLTKQTVKKIIERGGTILRLHRQDDDILGREAELGNAADDRDRDDLLAVGRAQAQAFFAERLEIGAAGNQRDVMTGAEQPRAEQPADRAGAEDDVAAQC